MLSILSFCRLSHSLSPHNGSIDCHLEDIAMVVLFAWKLCPKLNAIMHFQSCIEL